MSEEQRQLPHYTFSITRASKYKGVFFDMPVPEKCVGCGRGMLRYEYAMGICTTCMNNGKSPGEVITVSEQDRRRQDN